MVCELVLVSEVSHFYSMSTLSSGMSHNVRVCAVAGLGAKMNDRRE
jgi:hypothetical protein